MGKPIDLNNYIGWLTDNFDPSISWKDLEWIREFWDGPMVIKGILDPEDAKDAVRFGADGIIVSNHGGRQLDGVLSSAKALPSIADAVKGDQNPCRLWYPQRLRCGENAGSRRRLYDDRAFLCLRS